MHIYLAIFLIKTIFDAVYDIIKSFKIQLTVNIFWMIMVKTFWILWMKKLGSFFFRALWDLRHLILIFSSINCTKKNSKNHIDLLIMFLLQHELNIFPEQLKLLHFAKFCSNYQFPLILSYQGDNWIKIGNLTPWLSSL